MKKISLIFAASLSLMITSCKRDYTCTCVSNYDGASTSWTEKNDTIISNTRKKDAQTKCDAMDKSSTILTETLTVDCELK